MYNSHDQIVIITFITPAKWVSPSAEFLSIGDVLLSFHDVWVFLTEVWDDSPQSSIERVGEHKCAVINVLEILDVFFIISELGLQKNWPVWIWVSNLIALSLSVFFVVGVVWPEVEVPPLIARWFS